jgi:hypothetical protein
MVLTVAFFVALVAGYCFVIARIWQGRSQYDPSRPPAFWPFSLPLWRGVARAFPIQGACVLILLGGGIAGVLIGEDGRGYDIAMGIGFAGVLGLFVLAFPITFFNRPRFLVPPHQRDEPGALAEWRRERGSS